MGKTKGRPSQVSPQTIAMTAEAIKQIRLMGAYGRRATISRLAVRLHFNTKSMTNVRSLVNRLESEGIIRVETQQPYEESILVLVANDREVK